VHNVSRAENNVTTKFATMLQKSQLFTEHERWTLNYWQCTFTRHMGTLYVHGCRCHSWYDTRMMTTMTGKDQKKSYYFPPEA